MTFSTSADSKKHCTLLAGIHKTVKPTYKFAGRFLYYCKVYKSAPFSGLTDCDLSITRSVAKQKQATQTIFIIRLPIAAPQHCNR